MATVACLVFVAGLLDVAPGRRLKAPGVEQLPDVAAERDAKLLVRVRASDEVCPEGDSECVPTGPPIASARVRVFWLLDGRTYLAASAHTDEKGVVELEDLPRGVVWILADAPGHARMSTQRVLDRGGREITVGLPSERDLTVWVQDEKEQAIDQATVLVTAGDPLPYGALTDARGAARVGRLAPGPWTVKAAARGYEAVTRSGVTADLTITLRRLGGLDVRVVAVGGGPVADAEVTIVGSSLWPARTAVTDRAGVARIAGLLAGAYDLKATRGDLVSETMIGVELERGEHAEVTLSLRPGRRITALVTDGDGDNPIVVPAADVALVESGLSSFPILGRTGADGTVTLGPLPAGPATLAARADGFVPRAAVVVPEEVDGSVRIPLLRGGVLRGEVVDASGDPVPGASIEIIGTGLDGQPVAETPNLLEFRRTHFEWAIAGPAPLLPAGELGVMPGPIPPIPRAGSAPVSPIWSTAQKSDVASSPRIAPWVTSADGEFTARPVTPGRVRALVRHPSFVEAVSDPVTLGPGGEAKVRVVMLVGGALEGRVVDEDGRPVVGARVDLTAVKGTLERTTMTATDGTFAFAAVPDEVVLSLARPDAVDRVTHRETVTIADGEKREIELVLPAPRGEVQISVSDDSGRAIETAQVTLTSLDPSAPLRKTLFTDENGLIALDDVAGLPLRISVEAPGWARTVIDAETAPEEIEVTLRAGVIVEGEVTAVRGRTLVGGASVVLIREGARKHATTDRDGAYRFTDVTPGRARIIVSHPDYAQSEITIEVETTGRADRAFEAPAIDLVEPGSIRGRVVDAEDRPVLGARVAVGVAPAYLPVGALPPGVSASDARGEFVLRGVAPGEVTIEAYAADVGRGSATVSVSAGRESADVTIRVSGDTGDAEPAASGSVAVTLGERTEQGEVFVVVVHVAPSSDAESAGLRAGDVLGAVDGVVPESMDDARARLSGPAGSDVIVTVHREATEKRVRLQRERVRR